MGIRAELAISSPTGCPVAQVTSETGANANSVAMASSVNEAGDVTEEFMLDADESVEDVDDSAVPKEMAEIFSYGSKHIYRFNRDHGGCACERIQLQGCPITDVRSRNGKLFITVHTSGIEQLRDVLSDLRARFSGVAVKRLLHSNSDDSTADLVLLDRSELTDRQREVLETAHEMGYFEHGQGANGGEVAETLGINTSTFSEHLRAAQRKLLRTVLSS